MTSLNFVVIPTKNIYEDYSKDLVAKIKNVDNCLSDLDRNYGDTLNSRINRYKKINKNIITIGLSEVEHDTLMIHFNGARPKTMEMDDFIALLESYGNINDESDTENSSDSDTSSTSTDDDLTIDDIVKSTHKSEVKGKGKGKGEENKSEENKDEENKEEDEENCLIM